MDGKLDLILKKLEEIDSINKKLEEIDSINKKLEKIDSINKKLNEIDSIKQNLQDMNSQMNSRFDTLETKISFMQTDISDIKKSVNHIEENEPQNIISTFRHIKEKNPNSSNDH